jgi:hypothetical protein
MINRVSRKRAAEESDICPALSQRLGENQASRDVAASYQTGRIDAKGDAAHW